MDARPVLRDRQRDRALSKDRSVSFPFLDAGECRRVLDTYSTIVPPGEAGLQLDYVRRDRGLVRRLSDALYELLDPKFDDFFVDHRPVLVSFVYKHPGPGSDFYLHRDVTVNDPRGNRCHTLWVPLVDVGAGIPNGGLGLIPGSDRLATGEQGLDATVLVEPFQDALRSLLEPVELRAGDAFVYDARFLHGSGANLSHDPRPAIGCAIARRSEPMVHVLAAGRRHRLVYEVDRDFFIDHHPADVVEHGMPDGYEIIDEFDDTTMLSAEAIQRTLDLDEPPHPVTPLPPDLQSEGHAFEPLPSRAAPFRTPTEDVHLDPGDLAPLGTDVVGGRVVRQHGACGALELVSSGRRVGALPARLPPLPLRWRTPLTRNLVLVGLDAGARLALDLEGRTADRLELCVIECPQVRSGIRLGTKAAMLDVGRAFSLPAGELTIWNQGPGPALVLLRRAVGRPVGPRRPTRATEPAGNQAAPVESALPDRLVITPTAPPTSRRRARPSGGSRARATRPGPVPRPR